MLDLKAIGRNIAMLRENHDLTQYELADKLYVTHQAVSKWETGKSVPNIDIMVAITRLFNVTIDDLLCEKDFYQQNIHYLLNNYPRMYVIKQIMAGEFPDVVLEDVMYLLSNEERQSVISNIINHHFTVNIETLLPYLNKYERQQILKAVINKQLNVNLSNIYCQLSQYEKKIMEDSHECN